MIWVALLLLIAAVSFLTGAVLTRANPGHRIPFWGWSGRRPVVFWVAYPALVVLGVGCAGRGAPVG